MTRISETEEKEIADECSLHFYIISDNAERFFLLNFWSELDEIE